MAADIMIDLETLDTSPFCCILSIGAVLFDPKGSGIIDKIDDESERLTVMVSIFGRLTPVELGFNQVKR